MKPRRASLSHLVCLLLDIHRADPIYIKHGYSHIHSSRGTILIGSPHGHFESVVLVVIRLRLEVLRRQRELACVDSKPEQGSIVSLDSPGDVTDRHAGHGRDRRGPRSVLVNPCISEAADPKMGIIVILYRYARGAPGPEIRGRADSLDPNLEVLVRLILLVLGCHHLDRGASFPGRDGHCSTGDRLEVGRRGSSARHCFPGDGCFMADRLRQLDRYTSRIAFVHHGITQ